VKRWVILTHDSASPAPAPDSSLARSVFRLVSWPAPCLADRLVEARGLRWSEAVLIVGVLGLGGGFTRLARVEGRNIRQNT
jgi:hypothetical protein